jgi:hypothetical protein
VLRGSFVKRFLLALVIVLSGCSAPAGSGVASNGPGATPQVMDTRPYCSNTGVGKGTNCFGGPTP